MGEAGSDGKMTGVSMCDGGSANSGRWRTEMRELCKIKSAKVCLVTLRENYERNGQRIQ